MIVAFLGGPPALKYASKEFLPTLLHLIQDKAQAVQMHLAVLKTLSCLCQSNTGKMLQKLNFF